MGRWQGAFGSLLLTFSALGCSDDAASVSVAGDSGPPPTHDAGQDAGYTALHDDVQALVERTCSFSSCHGGNGTGKAQLNFAKGLAQGSTLDQLLVDVPSCEYSPMPLVKPYEPDQSWLMVKLTAPHDADGRIMFTPDPSFSPDIDPNTPSTCPLTRDGELSFGQLMPLSGTVSRMLSEEELSLVRRWIELGANPT